MARHEREGRSKAEAKTRGGSYSALPWSGGFGFSGSQSCDRHCEAGCGSDASRNPCELLRRLEADVEGPDGRRPPRVTRCVPLRSVYACDSDRGVFVFALGGYSGEGSTMGELGPGGGSGGLQYESMEGIGDDTMEVDLEIEGTSVGVDWRMNEAERTREDRNAEKVSGNSVER